MSALADIIAKAIADGEADAMAAAERVIEALKAIGPQFEEAMAVEPYVPAEYPKWVGHHVVENADEEARIKDNPTTSADHQATQTQPGIVPRPVPSAAQFGQGSVNHETDPSLTPHPQPVPAPIHEPGHMPTPVPPVVHTPAPVPEPATGVPPVPPA
jgi:hypothetical protein